MLLTDTILLDTIRSYADSNYMTRLADLCTIASLDRTAGYPTGPSAAALEAITDGLGTIGAEHFETGPLTLQSASLGVSGLLFGLIAYFKTKGQVSKMITCQSAMRGDEFALDAILTAVRSIDTSLARSFVP
jgi:hypothetical protein